MQNKEKILKIPYKFDSRYIFEDSLTRIFRIISEAKQLEELITNTKLPYKKVHSFGKSEMSGSQIYGILREPDKPSTVLVTEKETLHFLWSFHIGSSICIHRRTTLYWTLLQVWEQQ